MPAITEITPIDGHKLKPADDVRNQPPPLADTNLLDGDTALRDAITRHGADWAADQISEMGQIAGSSAMLEAAHLANKHEPQYTPFDRFGNRIDSVTFHPAYHQLMDASLSHGLHALPWQQQRAGAHVARAAMFYLMSQTEQAHGCPVSMTYACVPALKASAPEIFATWGPKLTSSAYDPRFLPIEQKTAATMGMAMTEKQGGSDVRANITLAVHKSGDEYELTGHKWFCSAPMCDAFLVLAQAEGGLTCFFMPRFRPDGSLNRFHVNRLKDKLGNKANASSEVEFHGAYARRVGEEGRGVPAIIQMVSHTRLDCCIGAAATQRAAVTQAIHHARHRSAFGKRLIAHDLMAHVLADLAIEQEAATITAMRLAAAFDAAASDPQQAAFARLAVAIGKYWLCKRNPVLIAEALECLGGAGYVEEGVMPRLYREAPLNGIWEGSGNVICLDVLRALGKEPEALPAFLAELEQATGQSPTYDKALGDLKQDLTNTDDLQWRARHLVERMALVWQAALLLQHAPEFISTPFITSRLGRAAGRAFGTLPRCDASQILQHTLAQSRKSIAF